jgi:nicotinate-nucleotide pyrophosphorylase (carboxylating)
MTYDAEDVLDVGAHLPLIARALEEDQAARDLTARAVVPEGTRARATVVARAAGVLAGLALAEPTFRSLDPEAEVTLLYADGEAVAESARVLTVEGDARAILSAERTVLNLLGHLGGVATLTRAFVEAVSGTGADILDTRKTLPGWRALEKYAVRCGGGVNHRLDLADAAMIKENHLYAAFGRTGPDALAEAIRRVRRALPPGRDLYVEVETLEELDAAVREGATILMLDGFDLGGVREAVRRVRGLPAPRPRLEVTGGVTLENVAALAATGVQRISIGALTHSARVLDLSLRVGV